MSPRHRFRFSVFLLLLAPRAPAESPGQLQERALQFHEACFEARISLDGAGYEREWQALVRYLKNSLNGKAGVTVTGNSSDWTIQLRPSSGPVWVSASPAGALLLTNAGGEATPVKTLVSIYPLRRHYLCDGKALAPYTPGIPAAPRPCEPPPSSQASVVKAGASDEGAVLLPVARMECCYQVVSSEGVLEPGQILVKHGGKAYRLHSLPDRKSRLLYRENTSLFVMHGKQPKLYRIDLN